GWVGVRRIVRAGLRPRARAKTSPSGEYASFFCNRTVDPLAIGSKIRAKLIMTSPQYVRRATLSGARLVPRVGHGEQGASGKAVTDGEVRCRRSMHNHQGSTLTTVHRYLILVSLLSIRET